MKTAFYWVNMFGQMLRNGFDYPPPPPSSPLPFGIKHPKDRSKLLIPSVCAFAKKSANVFKPVYTESRRSHVHLGLAAVDPSCPKEERCSKLRMASPSLPLKRDPAKQNWSRMDCSDFTKYGEDDMGRIIIYENY